MQGTVKWFNPKKGFGFVTDEHGNDVFLHKSDAPSGADLKEGDKVSFDLGEAPKGGQKAINVELR